MLSGVIGVLPPAEASLAMGSPAGQPAARWLLGGCLAFAIVAVAGQRVAPGASAVVLVLGALAVPLVLVCRLGGRGRRADDDAGSDGGGGLRCDRSPRLPRPSGPAVDWSAFDAERARWAFVYVGAVAAGGRDGAQGDC
jgi:hypothetical protein